MRRELDSEERAKLSGDICGRAIERLGSLPGIQWERRLVAVYRPLPEELDCAPLVEWFYRKHCQVHFPRVKDPSAKTLEMVPVPAPQDSAYWDVGPYGIQEPHSALAGVAAEALDLIVVPGAAFGESGERMGMGSGYYDRYLAQAPHVLRLALAFDFQLEVRIPQSAWDQPMHWIITERRDIRAAGLDPWLERHKHRGASS